MSNLTRIIDAMVGVVGTAPANEGTANTGVTAVEEGDGIFHRTTLTISQVNAVDITDNTAVADGYLIYTFPAGAIVVTGCYMSMALTVASSEAQSDQPEFGIGTVIGVGVVSNLSTPATFEDILTGTSAADSNGTALLATSRTTVAIRAADSHAVHFNIADTWADDTGGDLTADIAGTVVLTWQFLA